MEPVIRTTRLILRPYEPGDRADYIDLVTDADVMRRVDGGAVANDSAKIWWDRLINGVHREGMRWCARAIDDSRYVGHAMINYTLPAGRWELGFVLPKKEWGMGYATEIAKAAAEYSRSDMGLKAIYATVDEDFPESIRVLEKTGMKFHGYDYDEEGRFLVYVLNHEEETD